MAKQNTLGKPTFVLLILNGMFNILWCLIFFTLQNTFLGLVAIIINLILAILLNVSIWKGKQLYGYLLSIYPLWLCIANALNLAIWILN